MAKCFVVGCTTFPPTFSPSEFVVDEWIKALPSRERPFNQYLDTVCSAHFDKSLMTLEPVFILGSSGTKVTRTKCSLKNGAVPTLFDTVQLEKEPPDSLTNKKDRVKTDTVDVPTEGRRVQTQTKKDARSMSSSSPSHDDVSITKVQLERVDSSQRKLEESSKKQLLPESTPVPPTNILNEDKPVKKGESSQVFQIDQDEKSKVIKENSKKSNNFSCESTLPPAFSSSSITGSIRTEEILNDPAKKQRGRPKKKKLNCVDSTPHSVVSPSPKTDNNNVEAKMIKNDEDDTQNINKSKRAGSSLEQDLLSNSQEPCTNLVKLASQTTPEKEPCQTSRKRKSIESSNSTVSVIPSISSGHDELLSVSVPSNPTTDEDQPVQKSSTPVRSISSSPTRKIASTNDSIKSPVKRSSPFKSLPKPKCFVLSCLHECTKMFQAKDDDMLMKWSEAIPKRERPLRITDYVCADHFTEKAVQKCLYSAKGPDRSTPPNRWKLFPGAIPHCFRVPKVVLKRIDVDNLEKYLCDFKTQHTVSSTNNQINISNGQKNNPVRRRGRKKKNMKVSNAQKIEKKVVVERQMSTQNCVVPGCLGADKKPKKILFHDFPVYINYRNLWAREISRKTRTTIPSTGAFLAGKKVCSRHFLTTDYIGNSRSNMLRTSAVPKRFANDKTIIDPVDQKIVQPIINIVDLNKEDSSDLEITYIQTTISPPKRRKIACGRPSRNCTIKQENGASIKVEGSHLVQYDEEKKNIVLVPEQKSPIKEKLSKKRLKEYLGEMEEMWEIDQKVALNLPVKTKVTKEPEIKGEFNGGDVLPPRKRAARSSSSKSQKGVPVDDRLIVPFETMMDTTKDNENTDNDYNNAVTEFKNFCKEAKASTTITKGTSLKSGFETGQPKEKNKKKNKHAGLDVASSGNEDTKSSLIIPTLFLDSTKHGLENILEWKSSIKLPENDSWSVKLLTDTRKTNNPEKFIFVSEVIVRDGQLVLQRVLKIKQDFTFEARINNSDFTPMFNTENDKIKSYPRLQEIIDDFSSFNICVGLEGFSCVGESALSGLGKKRIDTWFSEKCVILCADHICNTCLSLIEPLINERNKAINTLVESPKSLSTTATSPSISNESTVSERQSSSPHLASLMKMNCGKVLTPNKTCQKSRKTPTKEPSKSMTPPTTIHSQNHVSNNQVINPGVSPIPKPTASITVHPPPLPLPQNQQNMGNQSQSQQVSTQSLVRPPSLVRLPSLVRPPANIMYGNLPSQPLVYGNALYTTSQTSSHQQQQIQREVQTSTSTQSNVYGNSTVTNRNLPSNTPFFSLAYSAPTSVLNSTQQHSMVTQQKPNGGENFGKTSDVNSQPLQQGSQPIFYYQPLQFSSDIYGKPSFQFPSLASTPTQTQPPSLPSFMNFGNGTTGMLTNQPKCPQLNSQSIVVSAPQQNYQSNPSNGMMDNPEATGITTNPITSFSVPPVYYYDPNAQNYN